MSHKMTSLDALHAHYRETPWHRLGNVGDIDWETARDWFDWCEVERHPIHIEHEEIGVILDNRNVLKMVHYPFAYAEVSDKYRIVQHRFMIDDLTGMLIDTGLVETIESVGTYDNGAVGYVSLKFKDDIVIPGWSKVESIFNIGNGNPQSLEDFIKEIELNLSKVAEKKYLPMQPGDVPKTWADISMIKELGYKNKTSMKDGVSKFILWFQRYFNK